MPKYKTIITVIHNSQDLEDAIADAIFYADRVYEVNNILYVGNETEEVFDEHTTET